MVARFKVVGRDRVPHPLEPVLLLGLHGVGRIGHRTFRHRIGEDALLLLGIVQAEGRLEIQALHRVDVQIGVTEHSPVVIAVVRIAGQAGERVLAVGIAANGTGEFTLGGIDGNGRVELEHILQESAGCLHLAGAVQGEVLADGEDVLVPDLEELVIRVDTGGKTGEVRMLDDTVILVIAQGEERIAALRAVAERKVVLLDNACPGGLAEPVGVAGGCGAGRVQVLVHADPVQGGDAVGVIAPVIDVPEGIHVGVQAVVHIALPHHLAEFLGIEHLHPVHVGLGGHAGVEIDSHFPLLAAFGRNDDDAVGRTASVDGGRGGVFQDLDGLDVVSVEFMHAGLGRDAVDDVERIVVVQGTDTAYADRSTAGRRTVRRDVHARNAALQRLDGVVLVLLGEIVGVDGGDGAGEVGLTLDRVAGDNHLVQKLGVLLHDHRHIFSGREFQGGVADGGENQNGPLIDADGEIPVKIGRHAIRRSFLHDGGPDDSVAVGSGGHDAGHFDLLGEGREAGEQKEACENRF